MSKAPPTPNVPLRRAGIPYVVVGLSMVAAGAVASWQGPAAIDAVAKLRAERLMVSQLEHNARQSKDALGLARAGLLLAAQNAVANPRLMAAVEARVDKPTFDDIFRTELWWSPYREELTVGIVFDGETLGYSQDPLVQALPWVDLIRTAREGLSTPTGILKLVDPSTRRVTHAALGVAVPASLMGQRSTAVLVFARKLNDELCAQLSRAAAAPVALSDGFRAISRSAPLANAKAFPIEMFIGKEQQETVAPDALPFVARAVAVDQNLWLWVGADLSTPLQIAARESAPTKLLVFGGAGMLAMLGVVLTAKGLRRVGKRKPSDAAPVAIAVTMPSTAIADLHPIPQHTMPTAASEYQGELGRYTLVERLGEGGMAEVFTAVSFGSGGFHRAFVVKRLRPEMRHSEEALSQFIDEANLAASLVHPNIVPVFDFGQVGDDYYLAQEYVPGRDLGKINRALIAAGERALSVDVLLYIAHEILSALEYVHDRVDSDGQALGMVHRDVSPENILISERGEVRLLDFGIVKANHSNRVSRTEVGHLKGNIDFMSPEQAQGKSVDRRSDLFSLGLSLYKSIACETLYRGESMYDRLLAAATGPLDEHFKQIDALPRPMNRLLRSVLAPQPSERFESAAAFRAALPPPGPQPRQELVAILKHLFGEDLRAEQKRIAAALPFSGPTRAPSGEVLLPIITQSSPKVAV